MELAFPIAVVYTLAMVGSIFGGGLSGYSINKGSQFTKHAEQHYCFALCTVPILAAQWLGSFHYWYAVLIIGLAASAHQAWSANCYHCFIYVSKKSRNFGSWYGGIIGAVGGTIIARTAGLLLDLTKQWEILKQDIMFVVCALVYTLA